jgi:O-antigen ligase
MHSERETRATAMEASTVIHQDPALGPAAAPWTESVSCSTCYLTSIFVFLAPVSAPSGFGAYDGSRFLQLILLGLVALSTATSIPIRSAALSMAALCPFPFAASLASALSIAVVSAFSAPTSGAALLEISHYSMVLLLALSVASHSDKNHLRVDKALVSAFAGSALLFLLSFAVAQAAHLNTGGTFSWIAPFMNIGNVRHFSQYQAYTLPLVVLPLLIFNVPTRWKIAIFLVASMWWMLQFCTGTRAVWIGIAAAGSLVGILLREPSRQWLRYQAATAVTGGVLYVLLRPILKPPGLDSIAQRGLDGSARGELWIRAWELVQQHPLLGVGPMHFSYENFKIAAHPHNIVLQFACEWGIPATLILMSLALWVLWKAFRATKLSTTSVDRNINVALFAALICGLTDAMFSGNNIMPLSQTTLFIIIGWYAGRLMAQTKLANPAPSREPALWQHALFIAIVLGSLSIVTYSAWEYLSNLQVQDASGIDYYHPRYWINGHWPVQ